MTMTQNLPRDRSALRERRRLKGIGGVGAGLLGAGLVLLIFLGAARASAAATWPAITLTPVVSGFTKPVAIANAGDGSNRLFVVEQAGRVRLIVGGVLQATPFLDISTKVSSGSERGLLGLAFPPGYAAKGYFYVYYTDTNGAITLARYSVGANPDVADPNSGQVLLSVPHARTNHNGGQLAFGPDGYLYLGLGDGGGAGDPDANGQNTNTLLGKILRLDVESGVTPYAIPAGNPFASGGGKGEIWAYGLRNPWRFSFDRQTHDLYIADVGQNLWEEVDVQPGGAAGGANYGWNIMEGLHCYNATSCNTAGLTLPVTEYDHSLGCAVIGGYVYRGSAQPGLAGLYFYADECQGRIWGLQKAGGGWESHPLLRAAINPSTFGEDEAGEIYLADYSGGTLYRLVALPPRVRLPMIAK
jgi:glucose/arabinose dehydrogenase